LATASLGEVLSLRPVLGRWFIEGDAAPTVVLGWSIWQRRWGGDPDVIGRSIRIAGESLEVIGVMPREFAFPDETVELWTHREFTIDNPDGGFNYQAVGRMSDGVTLDGLRAELQRLVDTSPEAYGNQPHIERRVREGRIRAAPVSLQQRVVGDLASMLWMLFGAVALVLFTTWANVANLFMVRSDARRQDVAVRRALGAGRAAIARFSLAEGLLLSVTGWLLGLGLTFAAVRLIVRYSPVALPRASEISIDANVVIVSAIVSLVAGIILTLIPLIGPHAASASAVLRDGGRSTTAGRTRMRVRALLMAGQVALALMLLAGAGLLLRSYAHVRAASPGFDARNVLFFGLQRSNADRSPETAHTFHADLAERIRALPGVQSVGLATCVPFDGYCWGEGVFREDRDPAVEGNEVVVSMRRVSAGYFDALRIPMVGGRPFSASDEAVHADVVVLSEAVAAQLFPNEDPIGRRVAPGGGGANAHWYTVVGVVADVATKSVMESSPEPVFYLPLMDSRPDRGMVDINTMTYTVRTDADPVAIVPAIRSIIAADAPDVPMARVRTLDSMLAADRGRIAFATVLLVLAATVALLLGAVGIHAVFSYVISRRTAEIGLRLALGASAGDVLRIVLAQAGTVTLVGTVAGLAAAAGLTRLLSSLLFGVEPLDAGVFIAATSILLLVALLAAVLPARRAWRLRPVDALRTE
jgi:putative ABC transport system permease protein